MDCRLCPFRRNRRSIGLRRAILRYKAQSSCVRHLFDRASQGLVGSAHRINLVDGVQHRDFYQDLLAKGRKPTMARLTLARKIAAITLIVWKKEVRFDATYLKTTSSLSASG